MELSVSEQQQLEVKVKLVPRNLESEEHEHKSTNGKVIASDAESQISQHKPSNPKKDLHKIFLLIYLYFLQGIPLGLAATMPFLLSARGVSYSDQGTFSFSIWPFSLKILWAPIVDSMYIKKIGRRKTWLVPVQFLMALFLFTFADKVQYLIDHGNTKADIIVLTSVFIVFIFLASTQDIALDGWAVSMLSKENVSWQATCQFVGQAIGYIFGNIIFIVLESTRFSNQYIRAIFSLPEQNHGIITLKMFMYFFGAIFIVTTFLILFFIDENKMKSSDLNEKEEERKRLGFFETYSCIWKMLSNTRVKQLAFVLLTSRIGWATDSALFLKMIDYGVSKESIAMMTVPVIPINILWPLVISRWTNGPKPLIIYARCIPIKLFVATLCCTFIYFLRDFKNDQGEYDYKFYITCIFVIGLNTCVDLTRATSMMAFMAKITDESIGGTYLTFLTTLSNLGGKYPATLALYFINWFTIKFCDYKNEVTESVGSSSTTIEPSTLMERSANNTCSTTQESTNCKETGGICVTTLDAFYYLTILMISLGILWCIFFRRIFRVLNNSRKSEWKLVKK